MESKDYLCDPSFSNTLLEMGDVIRPDESSTREDVGHPTQGGTLTSGVRRELPDSRPWDSNPEPQLYEGALEARREA